MTGKPLGVAVVGLGIGEQHARMFSTLPLCRVRALFDFDRDRAERLAAEFPGCEVVSRFDDFLSRPDIDIVSIASFDNDHFEQTRSALDAGKHVFVEKPLCRTQHELDEIRRLVNRNQTLHLASNLVLRGAELYRWLRQEILSGAFGDIYAFDGDYLYGRLHKITDGWRGEVDQYSVMLGGGIHMIDLMLWLTGQRPARVSAVSSRMASQGTGFRYDDFSAATLIFESGLIARITANFACVHRHQHVLRIFGTRKTFILDDAGARVMTSRDPVQPGMYVAPPEFIALAAKPEHKGALIPAFVEGIVSGAPSRTPESDLTLDSIAVAIACDEAAASSSTVEIAYT